MAQEIERKFLLASDAWRREAGAGTPYRQGYLNRGPHCSVRVRVSPNDARLNIKSARLGISRREYEYSIPPAEAADMLAELTTGAVVEKTRYWVVHAGHTWEVDVFAGENQGLEVAEIELASEDEAFARPPWIGCEVSDIARYYNVCLAERPFRDWSEAEQNGDE